MTTKRTAKRRLTNIDFSKDGSHLALVHKDQGGAASGYSTLITKATEKYSPEFIQKVQLVRVTMELDDYLEKFFGLWSSDAKVLAAFLGYDESQELDTGVYNDDSFWEWWEDKFEENPTQTWREPTDADKQEWLAYRLEGIEIIKSLKDPSSRLEVLSNLSEDDYLKVIKEQERFEKALNSKKQELQSGGAKEPTKKVVTKKVTPTKKATKAVTQEENNMSGTPEMIAKAQFDEIQKALDKQKVELQKALDDVKAFQAKEKEAVQKARKADLLGAVEVEETAEKLFKAVGELEAEAFDVVVEVVKALNAKVETNEMFIEKGVQGKGALNDNMNPVEKALKARLAKAQA